MPPYFLSDLSLESRQSAAPMGQVLAEGKAKCCVPRVQVDSAVKDFRTQLAGFELAPFPYLMKVYMGNTANRDLRSRFTEFLDWVSAVRPSQEVLGEHARWEETTSSFYERKMRHVWPLW